MQFRVFWDVAPCDYKELHTEDSQLHTRRRENLKPHKMYECLRSTE
jgi:hypothetical protein